MLPDLFFKKGIRSRVPGVEQSDQHVSGMKHRIGDSGSVSPRMREFLEDIPGRSPAVLFGKTGAVEHARCGILKVGKVGARLREHRFNDLRFRRDRRFSLTVAGNEKYKRDKREEKFHGHGG